LDSIGSEAQIEWDFNEKAADYNGIIKLIRAVGSGLNVLHQLALS
jgi:hypothetical protein